MSSSTSWTGAVAFGLSIALTHVFLQSDMFFHRKPLIKGLFIYPIKSCKGIRVSSALITRRGLQYDRAFMLVASDGTFITQRKYAKMALIAPVILHQEGNLPHLSFFSTLQ
ncbi:MOSC domain-containing protein [archaeon]|nr:MAG: MOSC domain-containing protein [archaeon]